MPAWCCVLLILTMIAGCSEPPATSPTPPPVASIPAPADEFRAFADRLLGGDAPYFGAAPLNELRVKQRQIALSTQERTNVLVELAVEELRQGHTEDAVNHYTQALEMIERMKRLDGRAIPVEDMVLKDYGLALLRLGEDLNCVDHATSRSCIYPIQGEGIHEISGPSEHAMRIFDDLLRQEPGDLTARWLRHIAAMTAGAETDGQFAEDVVMDVPYFRNRGADLGIDAFDLAGGSMVDDFDNDGDLDIISSSSHPRGTMKYYRRLDDGTFENIAGRANLEEQWAGLNGMTVDYDNDGWLDLFVLRGAWLMADGHIRNSLLKNRGDGTFEDVTHAAGVVAALPTQAAVWADFDNDGDVDLFIGNETMRDVPPAAPVYDGSGFASNFYRNDGDGSFTDVARAIGVTNDRYTKGVAAGDYDNDGDIDLYVSNLGPNRLYENRGDGTFVDVAPRLGLTGPNDSFVPWFFDYDNDGWLDLFVAAFDARVPDVARDRMGGRFAATVPALYRNRGDGTFEDIATALGLDHAYMPMGANFGDIDNDGYLDIYLGTGRPGLENIVPNVMLKNDGGERFVDVTTPGGFGHLQKGHGIAFADIDQDGDDDIYQQLGGFFPVDRYGNALYENPGNEHHFLLLKLRGVDTNRFGFGTRIAVTTDGPGGPRTFHRAHGSVSSFGGSPISRLSIGLGDATRITSVVVEWPVSGTTTRLDGVDLDSFIEVVEGEDTFRELPFEPIPFVAKPVDHAHH